MQTKVTNLWYFWDGPALPAVCSLGIKTLLNHAKGFDIYALNAKNIRNYLPDLDKRWETIKKWPHKTDYIKPRILCKYGGIFVDVDVICLDDLSIFTNILEKSTATFMLDGLGREEFLSISLLIAKPESPVSIKFITLQDKYMEKNNFRVIKWHDIGGNLLNQCKLPNQIITIRYQRPFPVSQSRSKYLSRTKWFKFIRKTKGIPKPVIWPISYSSYFNCASISEITESAWLHGNYMISSAFRHALGLENKKVLL